MEKRQINLKKRIISNSDTLIFYQQNSTFELFVTYTYNEGEETEVHRMKEKTFHVYVDSHDRSLLIQSLVELKNLLLQQGRYTDCVDELIFKVINAPLKKIKTVYVGGQDE